MIEPVGEHARKLERDAIADWLEADALEAEKESQKVIRGEYGLSARDKEKWGALVAMKRGLAKSIRAGKHLEA